MLLEGIGASLKVVLSQYKNETFYSLVALITFFLQSPFQWILRGQPLHPKKETATYICPKNQQTQTHTHTLSLFLFSIPFFSSFFRSLSFCLALSLWISKSFLLLHFFHATNSRHSRYHITATIWYQVLSVLSSLSFAILLFTPAL